MYLLPHEEWLAFLPFITLGIALKGLRSSRRAPETPLEQNRFLDYLFSIQNQFLAYNACLRSLP